MTPGRILYFLFSLAATGFLAFMTWAWWLVQGASAGGPNPALNLIFLLVIPAVYLLFTTATAFRRSAGVAVRIVHHTLFAASFIVLVAFQIYPFLPVPMLLAWGWICLHPSTRPESHAPVT